MRERAYAEVNLKTLKQNIIDIRKTLSKKTKFMAIVKADAYGHGAVEVARATLDVGAEYLGVAWVKEARVLRQANINAPILLLSEPQIETIPVILDLGITPAVYTEKFARNLSQEASKINKRIKVHIKVDTGMGRIGVQPEETISLLENIFGLKNLEVEGLFTHFACADEKDKDYTKKQFSRFQNLICKIERKGITIPLKHAANSAATLNFKETHLDLVRIGIAMYKNVLSFKTKVSFIKTVPADFSISYSRTYKTKEKTNIATLSVGYADGYSRALSNRGTVIVQRNKYPIVGRICMDMTIVDIGNNDTIERGDEVTLIGREEEAQITTLDLAKLTNTIEYEVMCGIGKRVPRIYIES